MTKPTSKLDKTIDSLDSEAIDKVRQETRSLPAVTKEEIEAADAGFSEDERPTKSDLSQEAAVKKMKAAEAKAEAFICGLDKVETVLLLVVSKMSTFGKGMAASLVFWVIAMGLMTVILVRQEKILDSYEGLKKEQTETKEQQQEMVATQIRVERKVTETEVKVQATQEKLDEEPKVEIVPDEKRPGRAKIVVRSRKPKPDPKAAPPSAAKPRPAPKPAPTTVEIPIHAPAKPAPAPKPPLQVPETPKK